MCTCKLYYYDYYYHRFTAPWIVSGTTRVSRHQKVKTKLTNLDLPVNYTLAINPNLNRNANPNVTD